MYYSHPACIRGLQKTQPMPFPFHTLVFCTILEVSYLMSIVQYSEIQWGFFKREWTNASWRSQGTTPSFKEELRTTRTHYPWGILRSQDGYGSREHVAKLTVLQILSLYKSQITRQEFFLDTTTRPMSNTEQIWKISSDKNLHNFLYTPLFCALIMQENLCHQTGLVQQSVDAVRAKKDWTFPALSIVR